jgi:UDP-3-O-[3-hydroxymyristoyl] glucosamine N-acyltransferase
MTMTLGELAVRFGCELRGDPAATVDSVASLAQASDRAVSFLANPKYVEQLEGTRAGAVILDARSAAHSPVATLVAANPHATFARVAGLLHPDPPLKPGVHPLAAVAPGAHIDPSAEIGAHACIATGVRIGAALPDRDRDRWSNRTPSSAKTPGLMARAFIGHHVKIGVRCIVQPGAVIGADGFGFAPEKGHLGSRCRRWAASPWATTSRSAPIPPSIAARSRTPSSKDGVKLDNLIMIAHNCRIGAHTAIAACVGIAGSTTLGKRCIIGGRVGLTGHITLCDDVVVLGTVVHFTFHQQAGCVFFRAAERRGGRVAPHRGPHQAARLDGEAPAGAGETHGLFGGEPGIFRGLTK